jgi:prepilin-type N-terminal cleavage/methylation domain
MQRVPPRRAFTLIELLTVIAIIGILAAILIPVVGKVRQSANQAKSLSNLRTIGMAVQAYVEDNRQRYFGNGPNASQRVYQQLGSYVGKRGTPQVFDGGGGWMWTRYSDAYRTPEFHHPATPAEAFDPTSGVDQATGCYALNHVLMDESDPARRIWSKYSTRDIPDPSLTALAAERDANSAGWHLFSTADRLGIMSNYGSGGKTPANSGSATGSAGVLFFDYHVKNVNLGTLKWPLTRANSPDFVVDFR